MSSSQSKALKLSELKNIQPFSSPNPQRVSTTSLLGSLKPWGRTYASSDAASNKLASLRIVHLHHTLLALIAHTKIQLYSFESHPNYDLSDAMELDVPVLFAASNFQAAGVNLSDPYLVIVTNTNTLVMFAVDFKLRKLIRKNTLNVGRGEIRAINFLSQNNLFCYTSTDRLVRVGCHKGKMVNKSEVALAKLHNAQTHGTISQIFILGSVADEQEDTVFLFLCTCKEEVNFGSKQYFEGLFLKEVTKKPESLEEGELYLVKEYVSSHTLFATCQIYKFRDSFCLMLYDEIGIIKKKFNNYYFLDAIRSKWDKPNLLILENSGVICFYKKDLMELSKLHLGQPKCHLKVLDVVYFEELNEDETLLYLAPMRVHDVTSFVAIFGNLQKGMVKFSMVEKVDAMAKLLELAQQRNQRKLTLPYIQELGLNLDISKRDFYLKLYNMSKRELIDVNDKLLETDDVSTIKKEVKSFLRRKKIPLHEVLKIFTKLLEIISIKLRTTLNRKLLKDYIKCHFLIRKIRIQPNMTQAVGFGEFMEIKNKGIIDYLHGAIDNEIRIQEKLQSANDKDKNLLSKQTQKNEAIIKDVLCEFRIVLLEDYEAFLKEMLRPFTKDILLILDKFYFILPKHPYTFEFKTIASQQANNEPTLETTAVVNRSMRDTQFMQGNQQNKIFEPVKETEWNREMSRQRIIRELSQYHNTSHVQHALQEVSDSLFGKNFKLIKHALMGSNLNEYLEKVNRLSGLKIFLSLADFTNKQNLNNPEGYDIPPTLTQKFKVKNELCGDELNKCRFFASLGYFMLKEKVSDEELTMDQLINLPDQDLIAMFFLGNRQKKKLVLQQLRRLYQDQPGQEQLYYSPPLEHSRFDEVIAKFVRSENCSPVETKLLAEEIALKPKDFQEENQLLIQIIVNGFCQRLEVREDQRIQEFIELFKPIYLSQELNERMAKIIKITEMVQFFAHFRCETQKLQKLLDMGRLVLSDILQNYFLGEIQRNAIVIDGHEIGLDTPRNMVNILLYLQERLYPEITEWDVMVIFGERMVDYQVFDVLSQIIYEDNVPETLGLDPAIYTQAIVQNCLAKVYSDRSITSFESVKQHMYQILDLQKDKSAQFAKIELAKLRLCELITDSQFQIPPYQIHEISSREEFFRTFIEDAYDTLNIDKLYELFKNLLIITGDADLDNQSEYLKYVIDFAEVLLKHNKMEECNYVLIFLIESDILREIYHLITEAVLKNVALKFPDQLKFGKNFVEFYILNMEEKDGILSIFKSGFTKQSAALYEVALVEVEVDKSLLYWDWKPIKVKLEMINSLVKSVVPSTHKSQTYWYYYFLITVLLNPDRGCFISKISFKYNYLLDLLDKLEVEISHLPEQQSGAFCEGFPNLNTYQIRVKLLRSLLSQACFKVNTGVLNRLESIDLNTSKILETDLDILNTMHELKNQKETELVKAINRCQKYIEDNRKANSYRVKTAQKRYEELNTQINHLYEENKPLATEHGHSKSFNEGKLNRTMMLKDFCRETNNITVSFPYMNHQQLSNLIFDMHFNNKKGQENGLGSARDFNNYGAQDQGDRREYFFELFRENKFYEIETALGDGDQVMQYLREYYYLETSNIKEVAHLMQAVKLGEERNFKIVQSATRVNRITMNLKELFDFDYYFYTPESPSGSSIHDTSGSKHDTNKAEETNFYSSIFGYLTPAIKSLVVNEENIVELSKIIYVSFKYDKWYEYEIYRLALEHLTCIAGITNDFASKAEDYIKRMCGSLKFIKKYYLDILENCVDLKARRIVAECLMQQLSRGDNTDELNGQKLREQLTDRINDYLTA